MTVEQVIKLAGPFVMAACWYFQKAGLSRRQVNRLLLGLAAMERERKAAK